MIVHGQSHQFDHDHLIFKRIKELDYLSAFFCGVKRIVAPVSVISTSQVIVSPCSNWSRSTIPFGITVSILPALNLILVLNVIFIVLLLFFYIFIYRVLLYFNLSFLPYGFQSKSLYRINYNYYIENHKVFRGATFFLPCSPFSPKIGETQHGEMVKMEKNRTEQKFVFYDEETFTACVLESLAGLDSKLGIRRVCHIKGGMA